MDPPSLRPGSRQHLPFDTSPLSGYPPGQESSPQQNNPQTDAFQNSLEPLDLIGYVVVLGAVVVVVVLVFFVLLVPSSARS